MRSLSWLFIIATLSLAGCSSKQTAREQIEAKQDRGRPRAAAYAADGFTMDHRSPEPRPYHAWEFYYKHCALVSRNPVPNKSEYDCSDPY